MRLISRHAKDLTARFPELAAAIARLRPETLVLDGAPGVLLPIRRLADHGLKAWQQVLEHGYEGLVAKEPESRYVGGRSLKWLRVKHREYRVEGRGGTPRR